ncbi:MAG: hypothetical protein AAF673_00610 [Pseudomonadota bacterium]
MQKIVLLNGPSSAGKTSIANKLQEATKYNFMQIGIDKVISMMPDHLNDWTGKQSADGFWWQINLDEDGKTCSKIMLGEFAEKVSNSFFSMTKAMLDDGHNMVIDEVCLDQKKANKWQKILSNFDTYYIGITANLKELEKREKTRGDRMIGSARSQVEIVHTVGFKYNLMIDTTENTINKSSKMILDLLKK